MSTVNSTLLSSICFSKGITTLIVDKVPGVFGGRGVIGIVLSPVPVSIILGSLFFCSQKHS
jgi:hypothetical protein